MRFFIEGMERKNLDNDIKYININLLFKYKEEFLSLNIYLLN